MPYVNRWYARCSRCGKETTVAAQTQVAAQAQALRFSWERILLPFGVEILLCPFCARFGSKQEIIAEIAKESTKMTEAFKNPQETKP